MPENQVILNVDDTEAVRYAKTHTLRVAGFKVEEAVNGAEALQKVAALQPSLVLLDVRMPDMSGIEVCRRIKVDFPTTMVLQVSASYISSADRVIGLESGADSYLAQPVEPAELIAAVRALLRIRSVEDQLRTVNQQLEDRVAERTRQLMEANQQLTHEIAEREKAQASLIQALKTEALGQLTGGIAHDFNNLLMIISSNLQLLGKRLGDDDRLRRYWAGAKEGTDRAVTLTQRLLTFARRQELKIESVGIPELLAGVRSLIERSVGPMNEVVVDVAPDVRLAAIDRNQLELALLNLSVNARDAMPDNGRLTIAARNARPPKGSSLADRDYVHLSVTDTGTGMDAQTLARATEPFFSTKAPEKGTGLGLAMVRGFLEQLGGGLVLTSARGEGTTAHLWLPVATTQQDAAEVTEPEAPAARPLSILFVDDEQLLVMVGADMLESNGHQVTPAGSGAEALELLQSKGRFDLLITDHAMPGMTGAELAEKARAISPEIRVVVASGFQDIPGEGDANWLRLRKPYLESDLIDLINQIYAR
ncbi:response regulator [Dongia sedimenti]|uniref:histidine kinase n=1 Tax=Dongia sedimenti TaxID=3064282 RepID=A0ABU0YMR6_9PROT|nr:response regulator [Rhodospirillaceae bacterium R-7]